MRASAARSLREPLAAPVRMRLASLIFWLRFGARRLYPVPVEPGWGTRPRSEAKLNPARLFP